MVEMEFNLKMNSKMYEFMKDITIDKDGTIVLESKDEPKIKVELQKTTFRDMWLYGSFEDTHETIDTVRIKFGKYDFKSICKVSVWFDRDSTDKLTWVNINNLRESMPYIKISFKLEEQDFSIVKKQLLGSARYDIFGNEFGRLEILRFRFVSEILDLLANYAIRNNKSFNRESYLPSKHIYKEISKKVSKFLYKLIEDTGREYFSNF